MSLFVVLSTNIGDGDIESARGANAGRKFRAGADFLRDFTRGCGTRTYKLMAAHEN